jgi:tRNA nucleotidyltransferase/poly(A) polymerase
VLYRDIVLGKEPNDNDLATDALPDEMLNIFPKSVSTGAKFEWFFL